VKIKNDGLILSIIGTLNGLTNINKTPYQNSVLVGFFELKTINKPIITKNNIIIILSSIYLYPV
jgi:hypothetical protein